MFLTILHNALHAQSTGILVLADIVIVVAVLAVPLYVYILYTYSKD